MRQHSLPQHRAVRLDIVAAQDGEGRQSGIAAPVQRLDDDADRAPRPLGCGEVGADEFVTGVQPLRRRVETVSVLGHGEADDPDGAIVEHVEELCRALTRKDNPREGADHPDVLLRAFALDQRVETILRREALDHAPIRRKQDRPDDAPAERFRIAFHQLVRVAGHVGPVEAAKPEMNDTRTHGGDVVAGSPYPGG